MTKLDYVIALIAAGMALLAVTLWLTRDESIALEDAPPIAQQLVAESNDPEIQEALANGQEIRLRKTKPSGSMPTFQRVAPEAAPSVEQEAATTDIQQGHADAEMNDFLAQGSGSSASARSPRATSASAYASASAAAVDASAAAAQAAASAR